jgi:type VI protein secretion system component VasK
MSKSFAEAWAWRLMFGGALVGALGWVMHTGPRTAGQGAGLWLVGGGLFAIVIGVWMVWWRSRQPDEPGDAVKLASTGVKTGAAADPAPRNNRPGPGA